MESINTSPKLILLTGANTGIGLEATLILCSRGHRLLATVRSKENGEQCVRTVRLSVPNANIDYIICELSDPRSVRNLAEEVKNKWLANGQLLDVIINNAGCLIFSKKRTMCEFNVEWEKTMATNAIAPILLTDLLIDNLKQTAAIKGEARVVMVNSDVILQDWTPSYQTDLDDLMISKPKAYTGGGQTYKNSKVALMQATAAMRDELKDTGVKLITMSPGVIPGTKLTVSNAPRGIRCLLGTLMCCMACAMSGESNEKGGKYIVDLADDRLDSSDELFYLRGIAKTLTPQCLDRDKQKRMLHILRHLTQEYKI